MHSSRVYKGIRGEGVFRAATIGALALLCLFFVGILASLFTYTDWGTMAKTLFSREIFLAIRLSVTTATIATTEATTLLTWLGLGLVDAQCASVNLATIHCINCGLSL